jgi:hypothetical protein
VVHLQFDAGINGLFGWLCPFGLAFQQIDQLERFIGRLRADNARRKILNQFDFIIGIRKAGSSFVQMVINIERELLAVNMRDDLAAFAQWTFGMAV